LRHREKDRPKIILGIDPGSIICGYGIIRVEAPGRGLAEPASSGYPAHRHAATSAQNPVYIASGRIELSSKSPLHIRLKEIYDAFMDIIKEYSPDEAAVEKIFFAKSVKSALTLGHARGAALLAAASCNLQVREYSALEVKKAVVGYGRAEKHQVQGMVAKLLNIKFKLSSDSADALAVALCHTNTLTIDLCRKALP